MFLMSEQNLLTIITLYAPQRATHHLLVLTYHFPDIVFQMKYFACNI